MQGAVAVGGFAHRHDINSKAGNASGDRSAYLTLRIQQPPLSIGARIYCERSLAKKAALPQPFVGLPVTVQQLAVVVVVCGHCIVDRNGENIKIVSEDSFR